ncbi:MAG: hypothetical protein K0R64_2985 [Novosphingobium lindaniclasticum]|jgi:hypothetical protein|uniref:Uncharacterized protein n=1 Tax=Novosphingobium lindaniclasticum LE124 TaxID=1096930 RepID=T0H587_9SPHN|nr:hypothetical protein [Novosphingobium lindaniclasticum]EQB08147.1 hypothetical protein L284_21465 [Novosphingobium lindaniclasticum LE124]MDF2640001.1 hypothetical protein [Novosphingobium lindaniclasticum]
MRLSKDRQTASARVKLGKWVELDARTDFSPPGLVAVGLLVSGILLSTSVLVTAAGRVRTRRIQARENRSLPR